MLLPGDQIPLHDARNDSSGVFQKQLPRNRLESPVVHDPLEAQGENSDCLATGSILPEQSAVGSRSIEPAEALVS